MGGPASRAGKAKTVLQFQRPAAAVWPTGWGPHWPAAGRALQALGWWLFWPSLLLALSSALG